MKLSKMTTTIMKRSHTQHKLSILHLRWKLLLTLFLLLMTPYHRRVEETKVLLSLQGPCLKSLINNSSLPLNPISMSLLHSFNQLNSKSRETLHKLQTSDHLQLITHKKSILYLLLQQEVPYRISKQGNACKRSISNSSLQRRQQSLIKWSRDRLRRKMKRQRCWRWSTSS